MYSGNIRTWSIILSLIFFVLGALNSKVLSPLNKYWIKLGELLGKVIAPVIMFLIFFLVVTPIGLFMRLIGKDLVNLKYNKKIKSYWISRKNVKSMKRQF